MAGYAHAAWQRIWQMRTSPEVWLLASNLLTRLLGFVVSLLVSRIAGVQALGVYAGLLITGASPTTPVSAVLANNATMLAVKHQGRHRLRDLLLAHVPVLGLSALVAGMGCWVMMGSSGLLGSGLVSGSTVVLVMVGLVAGQLLTQLIVGLFHGADLSLRASLVVSATMVAALLLAYPMLMWLGLPGILLQAMAVALLPGLVLGWMAWRRAGPVPKAVAPLREEAGASFRQAVPNVLATVANNATNWVACIYLAEKFHGHAGLGLVAISLQWMSLMQLPMSSWGGRVMRALAHAREQSAKAFRQEISSQLNRCGAVSAGAALDMLAISPWVADLYVVDHEMLGQMFMVNALAAALASVNFVYERVFFCLGSQRPWLWVAMGAYVLQLLVTYLLISQTILAVAVGNLVAIVMVLVLVTLYFRRTLALERSPA